MKNNTLRWFIILGMLAIMSNAGIQLHMLRMAFNDGQKKFSQTVHIALLEAIGKMYGHKTSNMSESGPVKKISNDYYIVDVNDHIHADVLEFYLKNEFLSHGIKADFEYGIYDCETDQMVYGNYIQLSENTKYIEKQTYLPKYPELVYYFGIRFPAQANYVMGTLKIWIILVSVSLIILLFFVYAISIVLKQKRLSELQRDFVNNMTHEFKTPLTANKIALDFISQSDAIKKNERLSKYCEMISTQTEHLNLQIERILQISSSEKRAFAIHREEINLPQLVEKIAGSFLNVKREFAFTFETDRIVILGDTVHLTNMLYSLIDNSIKYSKDNSTIEFSIISFGKKVRLVIRDEGLGIERTQLKKIFNKFYRVPTGDIHNVKGFGLGLYYVKRVVERHGWKLKVQSKPGLGTNIEIVFSHIYEMSALKEDIRILYVEDDETIAFLTKDNLQMRGYQVDHVVDGEKGYEYFTQFSYHLCLVDIMLPKLDGYSLATQIRGIDPDIPILFLTAKSLTEDKIKGFSLGADDYITKPFSIDELVLRIEVFLKRSRSHNSKKIQCKQLGNSDYDYLNQEIIVAGKQIKLTQRENELMKYFIENANLLLKREDILKSIWGDDDYFLGRSLDVFISRLRKILEKEPAIAIENIHGVGFRFNIEK